VTDAIRIAPANEASCADLDAIFGERGYTAGCRCQRFKLGHPEWSSGTRQERAAALREQTSCGKPRARPTSGLVAYLGGEPVGWCAVEPRTAYRRLPPRRIVLKQRGEDPHDAGVWAVTCFVTRAGFRKRGVTYALARAAVDFARARGARALEGYPMVTEPFKEITWGELHVGSHWVFADAGFREVAHPTLRRFVMRIDFPDTDKATQQQSEE
jgi:GNAT superfamily N-acetyltransferase